MGGDQIPISVIVNDEKMRKFHFKLWGDGWKCCHCNRRVEWNVRQARSHFIAFHLRFLARKTKEKKGLP